MAKTVYHEPVEAMKLEPRSDNNAGKTMEEGSNQQRMERRVIRSRYRDVKILISDKQDDISSTDLDKFNSIFNKVENLHQLVQKPREQVADAEALLDITNTLVISVNQQDNGITPTEFVNSLLRIFGGQSEEERMENARSSMVWGDIGLEEADIFRKVPGCSTMFGPMNMKLKQRKAIHRKRKTPTRIRIPKELDNNAEERTDTDKNMATMFDILKKKRRAKLENLVLNRNSFAQTVENVFALSFLVKDGRVQIKVDKNNCHIVSPRNAPAASAVVSGVVSYSHFIFQFDIKDWKMMKDIVGEGEELMPPRKPNDVYSYSSKTLEPGNTEGTPLTTPVMVGDEEELMLYRNHTDVCSYSSRSSKPGNSKGTPLTTPTQTYSRKLGRLILEHMVGEGEEIMPHRHQKDVSSYSSGETKSGNFRGTPFTTPVKTYSRKRRRFGHEHLIVDV